MSSVFSLAVYTYTRGGTDARVSAATSSTLNFQARLTGSSGNIVSDGNYSIQFKIYNVATGGTAEWTETQAAVRVVNGYFSVNLASVTPFPGTIDWSQEHWLTMNVNGDGEMTGPGGSRVKLTAVPYAFRAGQADRLTNGSSSLGANDIFQIAPLELQTGGSSVAGLRFNQTGSGGLVQLQGDGSDVFTVNKLGDGFFKGTLRSDGAFTVGSGGASITGGLNNNSGGITNAGSITGVGSNITGANGLTIASGGAGDLVLDSASNKLVIAGSDNLIQRIASGSTTLDLNDNANTTLVLTNSGTGLAGLSVEGGFSAGNSTFNVSSTGNVTAAMTALNGTTTTNGTSGLTPPSTSLVLTDATNFDVGNYVQVNAANCGGSGINPCYAKITAKAGNTLTIAPGLTWTSGATVNEYQVPELGGSNAAGAPLANRFGRGYFISGIAAGNGTTFYDESGITTSLSSFDVANTATTLNIGTLATNLTLGASGTTLNIAGTINTGGTTRLSNDGTLRNVSGNFANGVTFDANTITSGTLSDSRLSSNVTLLGNVFNGASQLVRLDGSGFLPSLNGSALTSLNGSAITSGTVGVAQGGTGAGTFTSKSLLFGNGTGAIQATAAGTGGQLVIADTDGTPRFVSLGGDATISSAGALSIAANAVALGTDTTGDYIASLGTLVGLSVSNNSGEGATPGLSVLYGATSTTAARGDTVLSFTGSGNLTGTVSGTAGGGLTTNTLAIIANPAFTTVSAGIFTSTGALAITSAGAGDISFDSASNKLVIASSDTTLQRTGTGSFTIDLNDTAATTLVLNNSGTGAASLNIQDGSLQIAGTQILSNTRALGNLTGLTVVSGGASITGNSTFTGTVGISSTLTISAGGANITGGINNNAGGVTNTGVIGGLTYADFTTVAANPAFQEGRLFYDTTQKALSYYNSESQITLNIGQENYIYVYNATGSTISDGQAVIINGADATSGVPTIALAQANTLNTSMAAGIATHSIETGTFGYITRFGEINGLNTSTFASGDVLYVSATTPGGLTNVRPAQPNFTNVIARVTQVNATTGKIMVMVGDTRYGAYTTGAIAFGGADGGIKEDPTALFWDATNDRLGIGDATPLATLTVGNGDLFQVAGATGNITTAGDLALNGGDLTSTGALRITSGGTGSLTLNSASNTLIIDTSDTTIQRTGATGLTFDLSNNALTTFNLINSGTGVANLTIDGVFNVGTNTGDTITCANNQYLNQIVVTGGIVTGNGGCNTDGLSDERLKTNIVSFDGGILDAIKNVDVVKFDYLCDSEYFTTTNTNCDASRQSGVIAQQLATVFPDLTYQDEFGYYHVKYDALAIYNLKATQEIAQSLDSDGNAKLNNVETGGVLRLSNDGVLQNLNGLSLASGGASLRGGLNNNGGGITEAGVVSGVTSLSAQSIELNATASGNLLSLKKNGQGVFTIFNDGAVEIRQNSSAAFSVKSNSGLSHFNIDTSGNFVSVGSSVADDIAILFTLDNKNTAGDPMGVNGAQYYNAFLKKFRCYEGDAWKDCISSSVAKQKTDQSVATTNLTDAADLSLPLAADESYSFEAAINLEATGANPNLRYTFTAPAGAFVSITTTMPTGATTTTTCNISSSGQVCSVNFTGAYRGTLIVKGQVMNAGVAGKLQFRFAQDSILNTSPVILKKGSSLSFTRTDQ